MQQRYRLIWNYPYEKKIILYQEDNALAISQENISCLINNIIWFVFINN